MSLEVSVVDRCISFCLVLRPTRAGVLLVLPETETKLPVTSSLTAYNARFVHRCTQTRNDPVIVNILRVVQATLCVLSVPETLRVAFMALADVPGHPS